MAHICNCGKKLSSYHSLWRHRKICKKNQEPRNQENIVSDILNKVTQRANMNVEPMTVPKPVNKPPLYRDNVEPVPKPQKAKVLPDFEMTESETDENKTTENPVPKPPDMTNSGTNEKETTASEREESDEDMSSEDDSIPDNPEEMKRCFRELFYELHNNIDRNNH